MRRSASKTRRSYDGRMSPGVGSREEGSQADRDPDHELTETVYDHLRAIAGLQIRDERRDHTLSPTGLVHEAYLRMAGGGASPAADRSRFLRAAGEAMRRILIDHARRRGAAKRGGGWNRQVESLELLAETADEADVMALDRAFLRLEKEDARAAEVVRLRFYAGLGLDQTAEALGISRSTALRDWAFARAYLLHELEAPG